MSVWKRFFLIAVGTASIVTLTIFLFVVTIDPWDGLPLSPHLQRLPVTSNSRYAFPMLARNPRLDSAVIGTSINCPQTTMGEASLRFRYRPAPMSRRLTMPSPTLKITH
jgi:hypothetical protein